MARPSRRSLLQPDQRAPTNGFVNQEGQIDNIGDISFVTDTFLNASRLFTDGIEVQANYNFWLDPWHFKLSRTDDLPGKMTLNRDFNYLMHLHIFPFQTSPEQYVVGEGTLMNGTPYQRARGDITYDAGAVLVHLDPALRRAVGRLQPQSRVAWRMPATRSSPAYIHGAGL